MLLSFFIFQPYIFTFLGSVTTAATTYSLGAAAGFPDFLLEMAEGAAFLPFPIS
jgi:hypothetical protein